jgi:hypothetical protein
MNLPFQLEGNSFNFRPPAEFMEMLNALPEGKAEES